jgi:hypothetical protein
MEAGVPESVGARPAEGVDDVPELSPAMPAGFDAESPLAEDWLEPEVPASLPLLLQPASKARPAPNTNACTVPFHGRRSAMNPIPVTSTPS